MASNSRRNGPFSQLGDESVSSGKTFRISCPLFQEKISEDVEVLMTFGEGFLHRYKSQYENNQLSETYKTLRQLKSF